MTAASCPAAAVFDTGLPFTIAASCPAAAVFDTGLPFTIAASCPAAAVFDTGLLFTTAASCPEPGAVLALLTIALPSIAACPPALKPAWVFAGASAVGNDLIAGGNSAEVLVPGCTMGSSVRGGA